MTFTPERIAQLREILAKATPGEWASNSKKEVGPISTADDQTHGMIIVCADAWSRADASAIIAAVNTLPAALGEIERLRGSLEYIKAQSVSKAYATSPAMALNVIRANAEAALDNDFQTTVAEARSFLSRMGGRK